MKHTIAIVVVSVAIIVVISGLIFAKIQPFKKHNIPAKTTQVSQSNNASKQLETDYFIALLPDGYTVTSNVEQANTAARLTVTAENPKTNIKITIVIGDIPSGGLSAVPAYSLRVNSPNDYTLQSFGGMPASAVTFYSVKNGYELTAFWAHGSLYTMITISGPSSQQSQINILMEAFLDQWRWR